MDTETGKTFVGVSLKNGDIKYRRKKFTLDGKSHKNIDIPGNELEEEVWSMVHRMICHPKEIFEALKSQSMDEQRYESLLKEKEQGIKRLDVLDKQEDDIEMDCYNEKFSQEKRDRLIQRVLEEKEGL